MDQQQKIAKFRDLHNQSGAFIIPNPWDRGTARILQAMGFKALATTSAGLAFSLGKSEGALTEQETLSHCGDIVDASDLPVSADLEKGFGDSPESVGRTIHDAASTGLAGCSIEDHTNRHEAPIFEFNLAVERIQAACEAKQELPHDFVLTARCENFLWGHPDLDDTIARLQAFERAGADVLYAPGLRDLKSIQTVCAAVNHPVNVVMGMPGTTFSINDLAEVGVKRVSVGSALFRTAYGAFLRAVSEMNERGTFTFSENAIGFSELEALVSSKTEVP